MPTRRSKKKAKWPKVDRSEDVNVRIAKRLWPFVLAHGEKVKKPGSWVLEQAVQAYLGLDDRSGLVDTPDLEGAADGGRGTVDDVRDVPVVRPHEQAVGAVPGDRAEPEAGHGAAGPAVHQTAVAKELTYDYEGDDTNGTYVDRAGNAARRDPVHAPRTDGRSAAAVRVDPVGGEGVRAGTVAEHPAQRGPDRGTPEAPRVRDDRKRVDRAERSVVGVQPAKGVDSGFDPLLGF